MRWKPCVVRSKRPDGEWDVTVGVMTRSKWQRVCAATCQYESATRCQRAPVLMLWLGLDRVAAHALKARSATVSSPAWSTRA